MWPPIHDLWITFSDFCPGMIKILSLICTLEFQSQFLTKKTHQELPLPAMIVWGALWICFLMKLVKVIFKNNPVKSLEIVLRAYSQWRNTYSRKSTKTQYEKWKCVIWTETCFLPSSLSVEQDGKLPPNRCSQEHRAPTFHQLTVGGLASQ